MQINSIYNFTCSLNTKYTLVMIHNRSFISITFNNLIFPFPWNYQIHNRASTTHCANIRTILFI